jgi:hypothetical protein
LWIPVIAERAEGSGFQEFIFQRAETLFDEFFDPTTTSLAIIHRTPESDWPALVAAILKNEWGKETQKNCD